MQDDKMESWLNSSHFEGGQEYIEALYEAYVEDPSSVSAEWQKVFSELPKTHASTEVSHRKIQQEFKQLAQQPSSSIAVGETVAPDIKQQKVFEMIDAYRHEGHQIAKLDPLGVWKRPHVYSLDLEAHDLSESDLSTHFDVGTFGNLNTKMPLSELIDALKATYSHHIGIEYMHLHNAEEREWIQERVEANHGRVVQDPATRKRLFEGLNAAEGLEKYIAVKFPGAKRFSLEGGDSLIPMLREMIYRSASQGCKEAVIGMAHRGRLNVLINILGKHSWKLFDEFAGKHSEKLGSGDVKYHLGYSSDFATPSGDVHLALAFNPSHLEIVNPVVMGSVRSRLNRRDCSSGQQVLPITIHGDSAIAGQGIVQETFNMSQARGFKVGGSIRIVVNNQVGFTTSRHDDVRSTMYCTDVAKMVNAPIFHVNGDDPDAVAFVTNLAVDFRMKFKRDVMIELVCYRRYGHNEADEPNATQPLMYQKIRKHPTTKTLYADVLNKDQVLSKEEVSALTQQYREVLDRGDRTVSEWRESKDHSAIWTPFIGHEWQDTYDNTLSMKQIQKLSQAISSVPADFNMNARVKKVYADRQAMAEGQKKVDWGFAENLAYAGLLDEGYRVRIMGQDAGRGTFFHRHAIVHHQDTAEIYMPLRHISPQQGPVEIYDSVLSEASVLAFEYGYATAEPRGLTIWEAQFGDFANGAQVVIDQFLSSGEQKWGRLCGLTLLLPHGYEGQGPEHSSARLERYLQLCADYNMQVCIPSTPAQVYHMLRRQVVRPLRRPLVVMSPKSLLRHALAVSSLEELAGGRFLNVIDDDIVKAKVERVVFCSGKVYYDLLDKRNAENIMHVALIRVEQLYPFPHQEIDEIFRLYKHVTDYVWCQEEPKNQGAWYCSQHHFIEAMPNGSSFCYAGRAASASPAVGYPELHVQQQKDLVDQALGLKE